MPPLYGRRYEISPRLAVYKEQEEKYKRDSESYRQTVSAKTQGLTRLSFEDLLSKKIEPPHQTDRVWVASLSDARKNNEPVAHFYYWPGWGYGENTGLSMDYWPLEKTDPLYAREAGEETAAEGKTLTWRRQPQPVKGAGDMWMAEGGNGRRYQILESKGQFQLALRDAASDEPRYWYFRTLTDAFHMAQHQENEAGVVNEGAVEECPAGHGCPHTHHDDKTVRPCAHEAPESWGRLDGFDSWDDVLGYVKTGMPVWYQGPMDY